MIKKNIKPNVEKKLPIVVFLGFAIALLITIYTSRVIYEVGGDAEVQASLCYGSLATDIPATKMTTAGFPISKTIGKEPTMIWNCQADPIKGPKLGFQELDIFLFSWQFAANTFFWSSMVFIIGSFLRGKTG